MNRFDVLEGGISSIETDGRTLYVKVNDELLVYSAYSGCKLLFKPELSIGSRVRFIYEDADGYNPDCIVQIKVIEESGNTEPYNKVDTKY